MDDYCINCGAIMRHLASDRDWQRAHCRMCLQVNGYRNADRLIGPLSELADEQTAARETIRRRLLRQLRELGTA